MATELLTRQGTAPTAPVQTNAKGHSFFVCPRTCSRCGGAGRSDRWAFTGYTCFDCGGAGSTGTQTVKLYTADKLAKLNAIKAKADAKRAAVAQAKADQHAAEVAARAEDFRAVYGDLIARSAPHMGNEFTCDVMTRAIANSQISEKQATAVLASIERIEAQVRVAASSRHVGKVGERLEVAVTVDRVASFDRPRFGAPWTSETVSIVTMRDTDGNAIISKSPSFYAAKGESFTIRGTVKEHSEYRGEQQTIIARAKIRQPA